MAELNRPSIRAHSISSGDTGSPLEGLRRNYTRRYVPEEPTVREIAERLHDKIAAQSPEHAALVAEYRQKRERGECA